MASSAGVAALRSAKAAVRAAMGATLAALDSSVVASRSEALAARVLDLPCVKDARGVFGFLSMPDEVQTYPIVNRLLESGDVTVYVPRVIGRRSMAVVDVGGKEGLAGLVKNKWGIPEPPVPVVLSASGAEAHPLAKAEADDEAFDWSTVDGEAARAAVGEGAAPVGVVLVPGVAFDAAGRRCGHGRGYYGEGSTHHNEWRNHVITRPSAMRMDFDLCRPRRHVPGTSGRASRGERHPTARACGESRAGPRLDAGAARLPPLRKPAERPLSPLASRPPATQALCFDEQVVEEVPVGVYDLPVDVVVTPTRVIAASAAGKAST